MQSREIQCDSCVDHDHCVVEEGIRIDGAMGRLFCFDAAQQNNCADR